MSRRTSPRPSSMGRRRLVTADERDVHGRSRRVHVSLARAGATAKVKRTTRRRERREADRAVADLTAAANTTADPAEPASWWNRVGLHTFTHSGPYAEACVRHPETGEWHRLPSPAYPWRDPSGCNLTHPAIAARVDASGFVIEWLDR